MAEALRQSAPANVLDGEEMKRLEEAAIVFGLPSAPRQAGAEHRKRVRPMCSSILVDMRPGLRLVESYELCLIHQ